MINRLAIKNFRCFQNFVLDGICPVTLIAGENNVGMKIGEAAKAKAFDFSAEEFTPLTFLLRKICNAEGVSK